MHGVVLICTHARHGPVCGCGGDPGQCSHLLMDSLPRDNIGDEGARDLGAALQVNTTLTTLG
jgi:hypothetical protein